MIAYEEYRDSIENGDILFFYKGKKLFSKIIQYTTGGPYCHCAIAFNLTIKGCDKKRVFVVEEHAGGQRIVTLSSCVSKYHGFSLMKNPVDWPKYGPELIGRAGFTKYSYLDALSIGIRENFGIILSDQAGEVCSEMIAKMLINNGVGLTTSLISPNKLHSELIKLGSTSTFIEF